MNKKQLVSTGIILTLLGSNLILGEKYIIDQHNLKKKINSQYELIEQNRVDKDFLLEAIETKTFENNDLLDRISILFQQLDKVKKENATLKKENSKLKKELKRRKEVKKTYFEVTAYTAGYESTQKSKGDIGYGITSSGTKVKEGRTIACPPSLKFGTKLNIDKIGIRVCEDRGGAIKSGHLDLYMDSVSEALKFGRKKLSVEILN
jgi:3D (Asp-Asp-Asp) domain-containing protein